MIKTIYRFFFILLILFVSDCADERPFLSGFIKRAFDASLVPCDPYNKGDMHSCVIYSSAFNNALIVYDATAEELVLSPNRYFPLKVKVGPFTNVLAKVENAPQNFPFMLALDPVLKSLLVVRLFPSKDNSQRSFETPLIQRLPGDSSPFSMAAALKGDHVVLFVTYPEKQKVDVIALDKESGLIDSSKTKSITVGSKPSRVAIIDQNAIISDQSSDNIYVVDFKADDFLTGANIVPAPHNVSMHTDKVFAKKRDFGHGLKNYVALLQNMGKKLTLYNLDDKKISDSIVLNDHPSALYFPDQKSEPCCDGQRNWLAIVDVNGELSYFSIKSEGSKLKLEEEKKADLLADKHLGLEKLTIEKIIGGQIIDDPALKREQFCANNRRMFFISSFAKEKPYYYDLIGSDGFEVEAQAQSCEGEAGASRLGSAEREYRPKKAQEDPINAK